MAAQFEKHFVQDLTQDIKIRQCGTIVFNADNESNIISVDLYNGAEEYSGGGTVTGACICPDGSTVPLTGSISGKTASVTLTGDCFAFPGQIGIGVQVTSGTVKTTVLKAIYNVELFETDTVVDPGSRITMSVADLIQDINDALADIPASDTNLKAAMAPVFSTSTAYQAGQYVWYEGQLYQFTADHAAGTWTGTDAALAAMGDDVSALKTVCNALFVEDQVDLSAIVVNRGYVTSALKWDSVNGWGYSFDITQGMKRVTVTANSSNASVITFLASALPDVNLQPVTVTSTLGREIVSAGNTQVFDIPDDCVLIRMQTKSASGVNNMPSSMVFDKQIMQAADAVTVQAQFTQVYSAIGTAVAGIEYDYRNNGHDILSAFTNIMCCGDSLTASVVYTAPQSAPDHARQAYRKYPDILADKTGATVTYKATGGYTASDWWTHYAGNITQKENQLAIIYLGTNGMLTDTLDTDAPGTDVSNYNTSTNTGAYAAIVQTFINAGARVLLVHVCERVTNYEDRNAVIDKIGERYGCAVVDVPYLADDKYHYWPDGTGTNPLHYNDFGYAAWTESLIRNVGALTTDIMKRIIPV